MPVCVFGVLLADEGCAHVQRWEPKSTDKPAILREKGRAVAPKKVDGQVDRGVAQQEEAGNVRKSDSCPHVIQLIVSAVAGSLYLAEYFSRQSGLWKVTKDWKPV